MVELEGRRHHTTQFWRPTATAAGQVTCGYSDYRLRRAAPLPTGLHSIFSAQTPYGHPILLRIPSLLFCSWACANGLMLAVPALAHSPQDDPDRQHRREELRRHLRMERERWREDPMSAPSWPAMSERGLRNRPDGPPGPGPAGDAVTPDPRGRLGRAERLERLSPDERRTLRQSLREAPP